MQRNIRVWILVCLAVGIIPSAIITAIFTLTSGEDANYNYVLKAVFLGFLLSSFLLVVVGILGLYFFDNLKKVSLIGWRIFILSFALFCVLLLPRLGSVLIVADEGWLSLYKHPFIWLILALLIGNIILYFFKSKNNLNSL